MAEDYYEKFKIEKKKLIPFDIEDLVAADFDVDIQEFSAAMKFIDNDFHALFNDRTNKDCYDKLMVKLPEFAKLAMQALDPFMDKILAAQASRKEREATGK